MRIGLISDTHGNVDRTRQAAERFRAAGVATILHAGDVGSDAVLDELRALGVPIHVVAGNCDYGLPLPRFAEVDLEGKRFALAHGHDEAMLRHAMREGGYDYVVTGHTHEPRDERIGATRVINPGAVHRAAPPSIAMLDTAADSLEYYSL